MKLTQVLGLGRDNVVTVNCIVCNTPVTFSTTTYGKVTTEMKEYGSVITKKGERKSVAWPVTFTGRVCTNCICPGNRPYVFTVKDERN